MKKRLSLIVIIILILIGLPLFFTWAYSNINYEREYGMPELVYYTTGIIGSIATFFAVVIALFSKEIRAFIFSEHCKLSLLGKGFTENKGKTQDDPCPVVQSYDCTLQIKNDGSKEISNIQILLKEVHFREDEKSKFKLIHKLNKTLYWNVPDNTETQLLLRDVKTIPLFKIYPEDSCQTPDRSSYSFLRMRIIGCKLDEKYSRRGEWKTVYQLQSNEKILVKFECTVSWNGTWCSRLTEMVDCVDAKLKRAGI